MNVKVVFSKASKMFFVCSVIFFLLYGILSIFWGLMHGGSLPEGVYAKEYSGDLIAGEPVSVCLTGDTSDFAIERGYLKRPSAFSYWGCQGARMVKILAALPGDTVRVKLDSVRVNQREWLHAPMSETDRKGRPLPVALGTFVLGENECFPLSLWGEISFDGRYIGPMECPSFPRIYHEPLRQQTSMWIDSLRILTLGL